MNTPECDVTTMIRLLGRSEHDPYLRSFLGPTMSRVDRDEYYGSIPFEDLGVEAVFREAPWVIRPEQVSDPGVLHLSAFHVHSDGHEGYSEYRGTLPSGVEFGDTESAVVRRMGTPIARGGGGMSKVLHRPIPHWLRYSIGGANLQFQLDAQGRVEMATIAAPEVRPA